MATYFIFGAVGQVCTVTAAVTTALESGAVKKLSDHRVVQRR
jgi:hypothetical protein